MIIRKALDSDLDDVLSVERAAFDSDECVEIVQLLLGDDSAKPIISLLAFQENRAVGHIMFSKARLEPNTDSLEPNAPLSISILGPLAVMPDVQKQGIGGKLIKNGLDILSKSGVDLVFVLGHPTYYPRFGFKPAGNLGFEPSYPIPEKNADAWMVQELRPGIIGNFSGRIICADSLDDPKYWRE
ncbi:GNAT family N-acetyltransferase [Okeania sp. SIO2B3]|uniref:GNAT family N-acetyltransferase n=1 Tax=Okeania sp. SIO2B3 TaxID=2607784 RepID=UPI0013C28353|nr:N-acetyltransferase [Okeania sp. SIO2B3]NET42897.1 N-acetyltransferase [Okeania sp. SIO2B3]